MLVCLILITYYLQTLKCINWHKKKSQIIFQIVTQKMSQICFHIPLLFKLLVVDISNLVEFCFVLAVHDRRVGILLSTNCVRQHFLHLM